MLAIRGLAKGAEQEPHDGEHTPSQEGQAAGEMLAILPPLACSEGLQQGLNMCELPRPKGGAGPRRDQSSHLPAPAGQAIEGGRRGLPAVQPVAVKQSPQGHLPEHEGAARDAGHAA